MLPRLIVHRQVRRLRSKRRLIFERLTHRQLLAADAMFRFGSDLTTPFESQNTGGDDHGNNAANATSIAATSTTSGHLEISSDVDFFSFNAQAGSGYEITTTLESLSDSTLSLFDIDGTTRLAFNDDHSGTLASRIEFIAPNTGTYFIAVDNFSSEVGTYLLNLNETDLDDHGDDAATATSMNVPDIVPGIIEIGNDEDWFAVNLDAQTQYVFEATVESLPNSVLSLVDVDGNTVLAVDDGGGQDASSRIDFTTTTAGTHFLKVESPDTGTGRYRVSARAVPRTVISRHLFYSESSHDLSTGHGPGDDAAIDSSKQALMPGQTATTSHYTGFMNGITGIMVDIPNLNVTPSASDFRFRSGTSGDPNSWSIVSVPPSIGIRPGEGVDGSTRVSITWPAGTIVNEWLQVRVRADGPNAIVVEDDVHYWGNQRGETGNDATNTRVNAADFTSVSIRFSGFSTVGPESAQDLNKDGRVNAADATAVSVSFTGFSATLPLMTMPEEFSVFRLASKPDADKTIYLDFDGHVTTGTSWNSFYGVSTIVSPAYSRDGDLERFSQAERDRIFSAWQEVAEDFAPFDINVTTIEPPVSDLINSGGGDQRWGARAVITDDTFADCGCGGHAFLNSFSSSVDIPTFVYNQTLYSMGETISHEVGHMLGLRHDGNGDNVYYRGHGSGETRWGALMGATFRNSVKQWSIGDYFDANNTEDDLAIITSTFNGVTYRTDDYPDFPTQATEIPPTTNLEVTGVIEQTSDLDYFAFSMGEGSFAISVDPIAFAPNLDIFAALYTSEGDLVTHSIPANELSATLTGTVSGGNYILRVEGVGSDDVFDPVTDQVTSPATPPWTVSNPSGFSDYGSLGQYLITGSLPPDSGAFASTFQSLRPPAQSKLDPQTREIFNPKRSRGESLIDARPLPPGHTYHQDHHAIKKPLIENIVPDLSHPIRKPIDRISTRQVDPRDTLQKVKHSESYDVASRQSRWILEGGTPHQTKGIASKIDSTRTKDPTSELVNPERVNPERVNPERVLSIDKVFSQLAVSLQSRITSFS